MDFPKSVPGVGLVNGRFIDEDPLAATPGSLIPSVWGNSVTFELLNVIEEAGMDPNESDNTQLVTAIKALVDDVALEFATKEDAEGGTNLTKVMSPGRVFQAIAKVVDQATETAFGWLKIATQVKTNTGADDATAITPKKLATAARTQVFTAFPTTGTPTALTLTPTPAISGYATNQVFQLTFNVASGINPTLDVSGQGPKLIKQYDRTGAKVSAVFSANQISTAVYDGTHIVLLNQLPAQSDQPGTVSVVLSQTPPPGTIKANGATNLSRTTYAALFAAITVQATGTTTNGSTSISAVASTAGLAVGMFVSGPGIPVGATVAAMGAGTITLSAAATVSGSAVALVVSPWALGDGSTTFAIPDLRAEFVRGWDDARGVNIGRGFGTWEPSQLESHTHSLPTGAPSAAVSPVAGTNAIGGVSTSGATGGAETRPRSVALLYVIKY